MHRPDISFAVVFWLTCFWTPLFFVDKFWRLFSHFGVYLDNLNLLNHLSPEQRTWAAVSPLMALLCYFAAKDLILCNSLVAFKNKIEASFPSLVPTRQSCKQIDVFSYISLLQFSIPLPWIFLCNPRWRTQETVCIEGRGLLVLEHKIVLKWTNLKYPTLEHKKHKTPENKITFKTSSSAREVWCYCFSLNGA